MAHGLPIVAYDSGAVAEILGVAGVLLADKSPHLVVEAVGALLGDEVTAAALVATGRARIGELGLAHAGSDLVELLMALADGDQTAPARSLPGPPVRPGRPSSH
jgi:glycosyltransferase involved in cell wall biosynthesis